MASLLVIKSTETPPFEAFCSGSPYDGSVLFGCVLKGIVNQLL